MTIDRRAPWISIGGKESVIVNHQRPQMCHSVDCSKPNRMIVEDQAFVKAIDQLTGERAYVCVSHTELAPLYDGGVEHYGGWAHYFAEWHTEQHDEWDTTRKAAQLEIDQLIWSKPGIFSVALMHAEESGALLRFDHRNPGTHGQAFWQYSTNHKELTVSDQFSWSTPGLLGVAKAHAEEDGVLIKLHLDSNGRRLWQYQG